MRKEDSLGVASHFDFDGEGRLRGGIRRVDIGLPRSPKRKRKWSIVAAILALTALFIFWALDSYQYDKELEADEARERAQVLVHRL